MHMSDALLSAPVAIVADVVAASLLVAASVKVKKDSKENIVPLMRVMGAFIFAAQMLNFSIPGTGSSGHIVGGILLASMLGPWAAFLTLSSVIIIQCLVFADGGLMAIGCNIINMAAMSTLVAYPLVFRPLMKFPAAGWKTMAVSMLACVVGLELGACMVTLETAASGISALPAAKFLMLMLGIHLAIGLCEGLATGVVLMFVGKSMPSLLHREESKRPLNRAKYRKVLIGFGIAALVMGGLLAFFASSDPDGLEWSIMKLAGTPDIDAEYTSLFSQGTATVQSTTAIMPDYENTFSGIIGAFMVLLIVWAFCSLLMRRKTATVNPANGGNEPREGSIE